MTLTVRSEPLRIQAPASEQIAPPSAAEPARVDPVPAQDNVHAARDRAAAGRARAGTGGKVGGVPQGPWAIKSPEPSTKPTPQLVAMAQAIVAKSREASETLPLHAAVAQSTSAVTALRKIEVVLQERLDRAFEAHESADLPAGAQIVSDWPYIPTTRGVAEHLAALAALPGGGTVARQVNGTYMSARPNESAATIFDRWDAAQNRPDPAWSNAHDAAATVAVLLYDEGVKLGAQKAALALSVRAPGAR
jgi:hypothetical protein